MKKYTQHRIVKLKIFRRFLSGYSDNENCYVYEKNCKKERKTIIIAMKQSGVYIGTSRDFQGHRYVTRKFFWSSYFNGEKLLHFCFQRMKSNSDTVLWLYVYPNIQGVIISSAHVR